MAAPPSDREGGAVLSFAYHRSIAPTLGVLDVGAVAALVSLLRAIRRHPVTLSPDLLTMRVGRLRTIAVPVAQIAGLCETWDAAALKQRGVVNLALATWPNVVVDLSSSVRSRRRDVNAIAHKLDDPEAFAAALREARVTLKPAARI